MRQGLEMNESECGNDLDTIITSGKHKINRTGLEMVEFYNNKNVVVNYNNITRMVL